MTSEKISPNTSRSSSQPSEHILDDTTAVSTGVYTYSFTSPATAARATSAGADCPSGYIKKLKDSCYKITNSSQRATPYGARSDCNADSSHLVFIETKEENDFLVREAGSNSEYWIGIHERPNLFWDNGNQVTFANIYPDDWRTFDEDTGCYRMSDNSARYWFDTDCSVQYGYICECEGADCPSGYNKMLNYSYYKFVDTDPGVTMSEARSECEGNSSHLVFIETKEENDFLVKEAGGNTQYWIGIHERPNLFWDNGNQVAFANIDPDNDATFNDATGCYVMSSNDGNYWIDIQCSARYGYICECEGADCPSEYNKKLDDSCYKVVDSPPGATLSEARSACKGNSSHLVFIETKEENDFLVREAGSNTQYWIGIHQRPNLFWDNGNQVTFANIDPGNWDTFDDDTGCYVMTGTGERYWIDTYCTGQYGFICEYEGTDCPTTYIKSNFSCYKFVDSGATRSEARSACKADSSHLVFIETEDENDFLVREATSGIEYWIGIHQRPNLFWDNGNQVAFANIDPDNSHTFAYNTGCYRMSNTDENYWLEGYCDRKFGYICEYEG
ncbi:Macrophage mannose receptor 1 [Holothuria leucospilota]|uniref:Macrophage mannose receptor 1 n=1 Tax=Holothuria leucospilota TaxID=206669 RepID=A0A9Q1HD03_HOLLE|nr:Macrophage mannose receptor 1 [Holothuria leucospilota]